MSVFRRKRTNKKGKVATGGMHTIEFRDHCDIVRRVSGFTDRSASVELERQLKRLVALRMAGAAPDAELSRFLESCPVELSEKLAEWGIIDAARAAAGKALVEHVADWKLAMEAKGNCADHVKQFVSNVRRVADDCRWRHLTNISASDLNRWLTERRTAGRAAATINHHLRAAKAFCGWLVNERRISENPLVNISLLNAQADRRVERHPYSVEELGMLLAAADAGGVVHGMTGSDRALLYRTAVETGFRWSECRSLTRASFNFESEPATVTIRAEDAKNGKEETLPLRPELAADLKARMAMFLPAAKAFPGMWAGKGADMIRLDLEAAGILSRDVNGDLITLDEYGLSYDFHGLRHTFATLGAKAGIPLAVMQKLMRHSDPKLTAGIYTHVLVADKADELAKLPSIGMRRTEAEHAAKTGTTDAAFPQPPKSADRPMDSCGNDFNRQITTYSDEGEGGKKAEFGMAKNEKAPVSQGKTGANKMAIATGLELCCILLIFNMLMYVCFRLTHKSTLFL